MNIEINHQIETAYNFIESTSANIFLTGKAGTGKTTFLQYIKNKVFKRMIVVAPTGVAAINASGVTIHSFFQFPFGPYTPNGWGNNETTNNRHIAKSKIKIMESLELLVIDEISMVRADVLDAINDTLQRYRRNKLPFGGVQLLMIGDVHQLAPVLRDDDFLVLKDIYDSPYFFHSRALTQTPYITIELETIYRQKDIKFTTLLNAIRDNNITEEVLSELNKRYIPDFEPETNDEYVRLSTHVAIVERINKSHLDALQSKEYVYNAIINGNFPETSYPCQRELLLKHGAQVMFIRNDKNPAKRYFNGKIGVISFINDKRIEVVCMDDNQTINVEREVWENTSYIIDEETKEISEHVDGTFEQYPIRTAWAITVHKSQGLTFEKAIIDLSGAFAFGQVYVALSRCKTLEGLVLSTPINPNSVKKDSHIHSFDTHIQENKPDNELLESCKRQYFCQKLFEMIDFNAIRVVLFRISQSLNDNLSKVYPKFVAETVQYSAMFNKEICEVSISFKNLLKKMINENENYNDDAAIKERISSGASYFLDKLLQCNDYIERCSMLEIDNKSVEAYIDEYVTEIRKLLFVKKSVLELAVTDFSIASYSKCYYKNILEANAKNSKTKRTSKKSEYGVTDDIVNIELMKSLVLWRKSRAEELSIPEYAIVNRKTIMSIQALCPRTPKELSEIKGMGKINMSKYADDILSIVNEYCFDKGDVIQNIYDTTNEPHVVVKEKNAEEKTDKKRKKKDTPPKEIEDLTHIKTFNLYRQGVSVDDIAVSRVLNRSTITSHLAKCVSKRLISPFDLISKAKYDVIYKCIEGNKGEKISYVKELLGEEYSYEDIKYVMSHIESMEK